MATRYFSASMLWIARHLLIAFSLATACQPGNGTSRVTNTAAQPAPPANPQIRGVIRRPPLPKPDIRLTTVDGKPFDLRAETRGQLTLVFFGYVNCPDICPVHVANVSKVLKDLPLDVSSRVRFVFITTDPERDTPEKLKAWLANFHPGFIGLTGTEEEIRQAQTSMGFPAAAREVVDSTKPEAYLVSHMAAVFAFTADDSAHVLYPFGVRQMDWANDLPILVNGFPR